MNKPNSKELIFEIRSFIDTEVSVFGSFQIPDHIEQEKNNNIDDSKPDIIPKKQSDSIDTHSLLTNTLNEIKSLEALEQYGKQSEELKTDLENTTMVFGSGNPNANIMFIGEAPGAEEDKQGKPFVGRAGQLLTKIIESINFSREDVYIANILKHRPPNNRDPLPEERQRSLPCLYRQIELVNPSFIVCLGRISAQTLLDTKDPMKNLRGRFHSFHNKTLLLVTYHPADLLRNSSWKKHTWEDVQLLRKKHDEILG